MTSLRPRPFLPSARALALAATCLVPAGACLASGPAAPALVVDPGTTVTLSGSTRLALDCDLRSSGAFAPAPGSAVVLDGYGAPVLAGVTSLADLSLALHGTASLANPAGVNGVLALGSGRLSLAGHDLTVASVTGGSAASYVVTPDTLGRLARTVTAAAPVRFPVGNRAYDPVSIRTAIGADLFRVAVLDTVYPGGLSQAAALRRSWAISHPNVPGVNGALSIAVQWNAGEEGPEFDRSFGQPTSAIAWRWADGTWSPDPRARIADGGGYPAVDSLVTPYAGLWTLAGAADLAAADPPASAARGLELSGAAPNPLRGHAAIRYVLPRAARVSLALYSPLGERVATLASGVQPAGEHVARVETAGLPAGVYFCRLEAGGAVRSRKVVVVP